MADEAAPRLRDVRTMRVTRPAPRSETVPVDQRDGGRPPREWAGRKTHKVSHLLADHLRRQILSGELAADQQLPPEAELTTRFRVSRDVLREALRILESQSLLEVRRGRGGGAVVRRPGLDAVGRYVGMLLQLRGATLGHIEEARSIVEPPAAEQFALRASPADVDRLVRLHSAERAAEDDALGFVTAVATFDQAIIELSENVTLSVLAGVFRDIYVGQVYTAIGTAHPAVADRIARRVVVSHSALLDAARRHDGVLARKTWSDYLFTTSRMLVDRNSSRQPIDITPLWRAQAAHDGADASPRRSISIATEIRARIAEGQLREGDRLPALSELGAEFEISRPTLREALRILEMEFLLDLRIGDRGGARIREPTTEVAAQLAGIVLEFRRTTFTDFHRAVCLIEPQIVELVATRAGRRVVRRLQSVAAELAASIEDTVQFVSTMRAAHLTLFSATQNPALTVIAEVLHWVRVAVEPTVTADASGLPWVVKTNRRSQAHFARLVTAIDERDSATAYAAWERLLQVGSAFFEESALGERLIIDLLE